MWQRYLVAIWTIAMLSGLPACNDSPSSTTTTDECDNCPSGTFCGTDNKCHQVCNISADCDPCHECREDLCYEYAKFCIVSVTPEDGATEVPLNAAVVVTFNERIQQQSINGNVGLDGPDASNVSTSVTQADGTLTITPNSQLSKRAQYTIWIAKELAGVSGNTLHERHSSVFTTYRGPELDPGPLRYQLSPISGHASGAGYQMYIIGNTSTGKASGTQGHSLMSGDAFWIQR